MDRATNILTIEKDNSALIVFRIALGFLLIAESWGAIATGWVAETFVNVRHTFTFFGFEWTAFLIGQPMLWWYVIMGILGIGVMLGYRYRLSMTLFAVMWALSYFMQKSHYNNHYYLLMLVCFWMIAMPAHRYASMDVKHGRVFPSLTCPNWCILFFKIQFAIVYFYAAVAKLYPDWLAAKPVSIWLSGKTHYPIVGGLFHHEWFAYLISYGGIFFDFLIIPALMIRQTRIIAIVLSLIFHLFNSAVFQIGIFPYFALDVALFFFEPDSIRRLFLRKKPQLIEFIAPRSIGSYFKIFFIGYFVIQILKPLRHHVMPGNVLWNEAGHRLSWRMMLRAKYGHYAFRVQYNKDQEKRVLSRDFLARHQIADVATRPDMLYRSIDYLKEYLREQDIEAEAIFCDCITKVNGRPTMQYVNPDYNMLDAEWNYFGPQDWMAEEPDLSVVYEKKLK